MMPLEKIEQGMNVYEVADALLLTPFSHPDVWEKRVAELRRQGRSAEADIVKAEHPEAFTDRRRREVEATGRALTRLYRELRST